MPSISGALGGAATGAKIGSVAGPWGTLIGGALGGIAGLFGGGKSKLQKAMEAKIDPSLNNLMHWSGQSQNKQNEMYGVALPALKDAGEFYRGLMSKDSTTSLQSILGPYQTAINDQYQGVLNSSQQFGARGGGKNASMLQADWQRNRALMELVPQMRAQAAEGSLKVGQAAGSQALDWGQLSTSQQAAVLQAITGSGIATGNQAIGAQRDQGMAGILSSLGELLPGILDAIKGTKPATRPRIVPGV